MALAVMANLVAVALVIAIGVARPSTLVAVPVVDAFSQSGVMSPIGGIAVANLSVRPGTYLVQYAFDARFESPFRPGVLYCGIVDNNAGGRFLGSDPAPIRAGSDWVRHSYAANFSLPDLTLGVRCFPAEVALARASFRNITLSVTATSF